MEADESSYAFALGSAPWELGDRSQPISGTLSGVGRVIVTIEYTKQKISSSWNKGAVRDQTLTRTPSWNISSQKSRLLLWTC